MQEKIIDTAKVLGANIGATTITIVNFNSYLTTLSLIAAISYTVWKWRRDSKKDV